MRWTGVAAPMFVLALACDKPNAQPSPAASASSSAPAPVASAPASAAPAGAAASWAGTYKSERGSLYYPTDAPNGKEWKDYAKWQGDDSSAGAGEGPIAVEVAPDGRVTGSLDAPLGPATINGSLADGTLSAKIDRKDPGDNGFTGTAIAKVNGDKIEGTMRLSLPNANAFRSVTFSLAKK